jgi:hypothetical protein
VAIKQEVNVSLVVTIGVVAGILIIVCVIGVQAWYQNEEQAEMAVKAVEFPNYALISLKTDQLANINTYRWVDKKNGVVAIPIDLAMKVMVRTQGNFPSTQPSADAGRQAMP